MPDIGKLVHYATVTRDEVTKVKDQQRVPNSFVIVCVDTLMTLMLVTSLLISRDLYSFTALGGAFAVREIHMFVAHRALLVISSR